jgi:hypothetical protein
VQPAQLSAALSQAGDLGARPDPATSSFRGADAA